MLVNNIVLITISTIKLYAMGAFFYLAYAEQERKEWMVVWIVSGLLVQPIFKVSLGRDIWNIVDAIWAVLLLVSIFSKISSKNN